MSSGVSRNVYVFIICLLLSTVFWFLNAFTNNYETVVRIPIRYTRLPENKVVLNDLPTHLSLKVRSFGLHLLMRNMMTVEDSITISPDILQEKQIGNKQMAYFSTRTVLDRIITQIGGDLEVSELLTDTIYFEFDKRITKLVSVVPQLNVTFEKQFQQYGAIEIAPAVVRISGPISVLDTIESLQTVPGTFENLTETISVPLEVVLPGNPRHYTLTPYKVEVTIPVEEYTETTVRVPVVIEDEQLAQKFGLIPSETDLIVTLPFSKFNQLSATLFKVEVIIPEGLDELPARLPVVVSKKPDYANIVEIRPERLEYIIRK